MEITHMVEKIMHRKIIKNGLISLMAVFVFFSFSSFVFATNYGQGTYSSSVYSTASVGGIATTGSSVIKGCKDPKALNYNYFVSHDQSLCEYENVTSTTPSTTSSRTLKIGLRGDDVKTLQTYLNTNGYNVGVADGVFGPKTKASVILFQKANNLTPDGIVGPKTMNYIDQSPTPDTSTTPSSTRTLKLGLRGDDVKNLQTYLNANGYNVGVTDGIFGPKTKASVILFQKANNLTPDGLAGPMTIGKMK